jgi:hypothetical protein
MCIANEGGGPRIIIMPNYDGAPTAPPEQLASLEVGLDLAGETSDDTMVALVVLDNELGWIDVVV